MPIFSLYLSLLLPKSKNKQNIKFSFCTIAHRPLTKGYENNHAELQHRIGWVKEEVKWPKGIRNLNFQGKAVELLIFGKGLDWGGSGVWW